MRFLLGVLVGYFLRGKQKLPISFLVTLALFVYVVLPATALLALRLDVQREHRSRPAQTKVPVLKGLTYEDAERKLHAANLKIRLLATRYDWARQPGLIIDQTPALGEEVADHSAILGKGPEEFEFRENRAVIPARESEVEQLINHFKDWIPKANKRYEELARQEIVEQQAKEQRRLQAEIDANGARARLKKTIKL